MGYRASLQIGTEFSSLLESYNVDSSASETANIAAFSGNILQQKSGPISFQFTQFTLTSNTSQSGDITGTSSNHELIKDLEADSGDSLIHTINRTNVLPNSNNGLEQLNPPQGHGTPLDATPYVNSGSNVKIHSDVEDKVNYRADINYKASLNPNEKVLDDIPLIKSNLKSNSAVNNVVSQEVTNLDNQDINRNRIPLVSVKQSEISITDNTLKASTLDQVSPVVSVKQGEISIADNTLKASALDQVSPGLSINATNLSSGDKSLEAVKGFTVNNQDNVLVKPESGIELEKAIKHSQINSVEDVNVKAATPAPIIPSPIKLDTEQHRQADIRNIQEINSGEYKGFDKNIYNNTDIDYVAKANVKNESGIENFLNLKGSEAISELKPSINNNIVTDKINIGVTTQEIINSAPKSLGIEKSSLHLSSTNEVSNGDDLAQQIVWARQNNSNHIRLSISPEHLGTIEINIENDIDGINIQFFNAKRSCKRSA